MTLDVCPQCIEKSFCDNAFLFASHKCVSSVCSVVGSLVDKSVESSRDNWQWVKWFTLTYPRLSRHGLNCFPIFPTHLSEKVIRFACGDHYEHRPVYSVPLFTFTDFWWNSRQQFAAITLNSVRFSRREDAHGDKKSTKTLLNELGNRHRHSGRFSWNGVGMPPLPLTGSASLLGTFTKFGVLLQTNRLGTVD